MPRLTAAGLGSLSLTPPAASAQNAPKLALLIPRLTGPDEL